MTAKRSLPLAQVYRLIEPGPVVLLCTASGGRRNVMTQSWHTMIDFEPPLIGCVVSEANYTFAALEKTRECVISVPTVEIAAAVVGCGNTSGRTVDKFQAFGLTPERASLVAAPRIAECYADLECRVIDAKLRHRYNLFVLQVLKAWRSISRKPPRTLHHMGKGRFMVAGRTISLPSRMK